MGFRIVLNEAPQATRCNCGCGRHKINQEVVLSAWQPGKTGDFRRKGVFSPFLGLIAQNMIENMEDIKVIPPFPGSCPICATVHRPEEPHDRDSIYYQNYFRRKHKRFPTWADAMSHCTEAMKEDFKKRLALRGIVLEKEDEGRL